MRDSIEKLKEMLKKDNITGLIIVRESDVRYLTNEKMESGSTILLIMQDKHYLITDGRFETQLKCDNTGYEVVIYDAQYGLYKTAGKLIKEQGIKKIATEYMYMSHASFETLHEMGIEIEDARAYTDELRMVKNSTELLLIERACQISDKSFEAVLDLIRPGITEREIANALENEFRRNGSDGVLFETIVASGPQNGASCHATVSEREIQYGDSLTIDFGATYKGYGSDITRTVFIGKASQEQKKIYDVVKNAKEKAAEKLCDGAVLKDIAQAGVGYITDHQYTVPHGIGHSFGLEAHEPLFISIRDSRCIRRGMITTIEPGIYVLGIGGVRIEDDYLITENGAKQLTHCTDKLIEL